MLALWITGAFLLGFAARQAGLPPLVGFLLAGFVFRALGHEADGLLAELAELGVLLLLFTVGLKIRLQNILRPEVWGTALVHLAIFGGAAALLIAGGLGFALPLAASLGAALGFSSTVIAAKMLEQKRELRAFHGRVAIGILIIQDLVAVALLAANGAHAPSPWAFALLGLIVARPLLGRVLDWIGHGELLVVYGAALALAVGGYGFELAGLSPELGALVLGALLADHPKAKELGDGLWGIKEFLLVGFFLKIGLSALPTLEMLGIALALLALVPVKAALFFGLLLAFGLRARTALLASLSLASYSEFGLIVTEVGVRNGLLSEDWLVLAALVVALSFAVAAPLNRAAHRIYGRVGPRLGVFERSCPHPDDQPVSLGSATVIVVGMGRVGTGAYDYLVGQGRTVAGLETDTAKIRTHRADGRRVVYADAEDAGFWNRLMLDRVDAVLLAVPDLEAKLIAAEQLRRRGFRGLIAAVHIHEEDRLRILEAGADVTYNNFNEAGVGFASHACASLAAAGRAEA